MIFIFSFVISSKLSIFLCYKKWKKAKRLFQELLFYDRFIEKPKIKGLKNIYLFQELPLYDELNIYDMSKAFRWYARNCKFEIGDLMSS